MLASLSHSYKLKMEQFLLHHPVAHKALSNAAWLVLERVIRLVVGLLVGVLTVRYFASEQYGVFSFATAFVALFSAMSSLGLDKIVVRDLVQRFDARHELMGTAFVLRLLGGFGAMAFALLAIWLVRPAELLTQQVVAVIAACSIFQAFNVVEQWFESQVRSRYAVLARLAAFLLASATKIVVLVTHGGLMALAFAVLVEAALGAVALDLSYRNGGSSYQEWRFSFRYARELLSESWPLILSGLAIMLYMRIDQIMLGQMVGDEAVGLYSAALRISEAWYFIPIALVSSFFPAIIEARGVSVALYHQRLQRLFSLLVRIAVGIAIPMTFVSETLVVALFGEAYRASGAVLAVHIWAAAFVFLGVAQTPWSIAEGLSRLSLQRTLLGAGLNIVLNLLLLPSFSIMGAAIATVLSQAFATYLANAFHPRTRGVFLLQCRALMLIGDATWLRQGRSRKDEPGGLPRPEAEGNMP